MEIKVDKKVIPNGEQISDAVEIWNELKGEILNGKVKK